MNARLQEKILHSYKVFTRISQVKVQKLAKYIRLFSPSLKVDSEILK